MGLLVVVSNPCLLTRHINLAYLQFDDGVSNDADYNKNQVDEVGIVTIGGLATMDEDGRCDNVNVLEGSSSPMNQALAHLHETMAKIAIECGEDANTRLCDHWTSLLQGIASNIRAIYLAWINKSMHSEMVFHQVDDGFKNTIK